MRGRLFEDHENAKYLADQLKKIGIFTVLMEQLDINLVFFSVNIKSFNENDFIKYLYENKIKISSSKHDEFRFVVHYWITKEIINHVVDIIRNFLNSRKQLIF